MARLLRPRPPRTHSAGLGPRFRGHLSGRQIGLGLGIAAGAGVLAALADQAAGPPPPPPTPTPTPQPVPTPILPPTPVPPPVPVPVPTPPPGSITPFVLILLENQTLASIIGNSQAPYLNSLAQSYAYSTAYQSIVVNSMANYIALTAGQVKGAYQQPCGSLSLRNLADSLAAAGLDWSSFQESLGGQDVCVVFNQNNPGATAGYDTNHEPFSKYADVFNDAARMARIVDLGRLNLGAIPAFSLVVPNTFHDMHHSPVPNGDTWLSHFVPQVLAAPQFGPGGRGLLAITSCGQAKVGTAIPLILAGPTVRRGYVSQVAANHYSLLRTFEDGVGLAPLTANDGAAQPLGDMLLV